MKTNIREYQGVSPCQTGQALREFRGSRHTCTTNQYWHYTDILPFKCRTNFKTYEIFGIRKANPSLFILRIKPVYAENSKEDIAAGSSLNR